MSGRRSAAPTRRISVGDRIVAVPETAIPRLWRPRDLAERLGLRRESVYRLIKRGALPAILVAGVIRVREADVLDYLARCAPVGGAK